MSITRVRDVSWPSRSTGSKYITPASPVVTTSNRVITATRSSTGERLPHFRKIIEAGGNATTAFSATWDTIDCVYSYCEHVAQYNLDPTRFGKRWSEGFLAVNNNQVIRTPISPTISSASADNRARAIFYKKVSNARQSLSGLVVLGELRETLHMMRHPAQGLTDLVKGYMGSVSKRKKSHPKTWTKALSDLWLEHSFGWMPFINDVQDAAKALRRLKQKPQSKIISAGGFDAKDSTPSLPAGERNNPTSSFIYCGGIWMYADAHLYERCIVRYKGRLDAQTSVTQWDNWALFGFSPEQFIPTAWELLPWSFLADYFSNIGDCLNAIVTSTQGLAYVNRTEIKKTYYSGRLKFENLDKNMDWGVNFTYHHSSGNPGSFNLTRRTVLRAPNSGITYPTLEFNMSLSDGQLLNVAALLGASRQLHPQNPRPLHRLPGM